MVECGLGYEMKRKRDGAAVLSRRLRVEMVKISIGRMCGACNAVRGIVWFCMEMLWLYGHFSLFTFLPNLYLNPQF